METQPQDDTLGFIEAPPPFPAPPSPTQPHPAHDMWCWKGWQITERCFHLYRSVWVSTWLPWLMVEEVPKRKELERENELKWLHIVFCLTDSCCSLYYLLALSVFLLLFFCQPSAMDILSFHQGIKGLVLLSSPVFSPRLASDIPSTFFFPLTFTFQSGS